MVVETWYPMEEAQQVVQGWRKFMEEAPDEVSGEMIFWSGPDSTELPENLRKKPVAIVSAVCGRYTCRA